MTFMARTKPPVAPVKPVTDDYFGTKVTDNYRYMENFNDEDVQQWVKAQADYTTNVLKQLPGRDAFFNRMGSTGGRHECDSLRNNAKRRE